MSVTRTPEKNGNSQTYKSKETLQIFMHLKDKAYQENSLILTISLLQTTDAINGDNLE